MEYSEQMSNLANSAELQDGEGLILDSLSGGELTVLEPRALTLTTRTGIAIERTLPHKKIRMIGPWCFLDLFGPTSQSEAMRVSAHPHTGLQTVTWLFSGKVIHHDSIGSRQVIEPSQLNLMTAGQGIAHSESSLNLGDDLHGVQLWIALPDSVRNQRPAFHHHQNLPQTQLPGLSLQLFIGSFQGLQSGATTYSPIIGAEISLKKSPSRLPLEENFEHGILLIEGEIEIAGKVLSKGTLAYLPVGINELTIVAHSPSKIILIGGEPFKEKIIMWWNFIGRSHEEIVEMRTAWESKSDLYPEFTDLIGGRIPAPQMPNLRLAPR
jgi:redox-sensitive bicupin YhaK (pirin superfamily)